MNETASNPFYLLPDLPFEEQPVSEHVCYDNPLAVEAAAPLFNADVIAAAMTWRDGYRSTRLHYTPNAHVLTLHLRGEMSVILDDHTYSLQPGDLVCCPAGVLFRRMGTTGKIAQWMYFQIQDTEFWEPLKEGGPFVRPYESAGLMYVLLRRILDAHKSRGLEPLSRARGDSRMLRTVLSRLRHHGPRPTSPQSLALRKLLDDIVLAPQKPWTLDDMAEQLNVSGSTLLRLCQKEYGLSPKELVIQKRMEVASDLLIQTGEPLAAIAESVGYQSVYSFSRLFRKHMGIAPGRYRKNHQDEQDI